MPSDSERNEDTGGSGWRKGNGVNGWEPHLRSSWNQGTGKNRQEIEEEEAWNGDYGEVADAGDDKV